MNIIHLLICSGIEQKLYLLTKPVRIVNIFRIIIPVKFTQNNFDHVVSTYYAESLKVETLIIFDLSLLEWINTEELAFLFAWIRLLVNKKKNVQVWAPYPYNIYEQKLYKDPEELRNIKMLLPVDDQDHIKRRKNRNVFLLGIWGMLENIGLKSQDFKNIVENFNYKERILSEKYSHLIIPFTVISSQNTKEFHQNPFHDVINGSKTYRRISPFDLTGEIIDRLELFDCYSPFENKIISNVITKELFANSLIHANSSGKLNGSEECYFALSLNNKWDNLASNYFLEQFIAEKEPETLDFYKDKTAILKSIKPVIKKLTAEQQKQYPAIREADLSRFKEDFLNISYLEFTFLDFGDGIYQTLREKFDKFSATNEPSAHFKSLRREDQILEYAFFPDSSRNQYHSRLQNPELFPRGLYFLVDMVRRYKGLLIVRSGSGKIVYDFSDKIIIRNTGREVNAARNPTQVLQDAVRPSTGDPVHFDGTMITIVLPERKNVDVSYAPVRINDKKLYRDIYRSQIDDLHLPRKFFKITNYRYISMLLLYEQVIRNIKPEELGMPKGFDSLIYISLLNELRGKATPNSLIFIDFELYPRTENIQQLLFYLTNSPFINEHTKAIIINLEDITPSRSAKSSHYQILKDFKLNLYAVDNEPHIFRPIPVISIDPYERTELKITSIEWIGVEHEDDEILLTNLLLGEPDNYPRTHFRAKTGHAGNIFAINQEHLYTIFNTSLDLLIEFEKARQIEIRRFINSLVVDGSKPKLLQKPFLFQTSQGTFQSKYLSLYETLHNKYVAKYLAKRLLDQYLSMSAGDGLQKFTKILTVTVSSQLLGVAIRDLIKDDAAYRVLKIGQEATIDDAPSLIMLASYYSFETEKPFQKINSGDQIVIVNDVISTGTLMKKLITRIKGKNAQVSAVLSVADIRTEELTKHELFTGIAFKNIISYVNNEIEIDIYKKKMLAENALRDELPSQLKNITPELKRINPLLNTVVELSEVDSEKHHVLFDDPRALIPADSEKLLDYQVRYFKIGHFVQNLSHNGYLTDMRTIFSNGRQFDFIENIKNKLEQTYKANSLYDSDDLVKLQAILNAAKNIGNIAVRDDLAAHVKSLLSSDKLALSPEEVTFNYRPDFIFFPVFSGVENLNPGYLHEVFGTHVENIIGLQRFETDKGWRFPFPPKRFNNVTRGKNVLIFDSGALTGESLVQMIDTISILDIAKLDVLSVIGRIEDFNREFFSRIKALKVKPLSKGIQSADPDDETAGLGQRGRMSIANLNIFFAINFHIPVYSSKSNCPFCEEMNELIRYQENFERYKIPKETNAYISSRIRELRIVDFSFDRNILPPTYIPKLIYPDGRRLHDIVSIFLMRDQLGRIDSYRFYKEYYTPFDDQIISKLDQSGNHAKEVVKQLELIMICILHEPKLYKVHRDLLVNVHDSCKELVNSMVEGDKDASTLNFDWSIYSLIRLYFIYNEKTEYTVAIFEKLFAFAAPSESALSYLSFILWKGSKNIAHDPYIKHQCNLTLSAMSDNFDSSKHVKEVYDNNEVRAIIKNIVNTFENTDVLNANDAFYNLRKFFYSQSSENRHSELKRIILRLVGGVENKNLSEFEINDLLDKTIDVKKELKVNLLDNLTALKNDEKLKNCDELHFKNLFTANSIYADLTSLIELQEELLLNRTYILQSSDTTKLNEFVKELDKFQVEYLREGTQFVNYCRKYQCDLRTCINAALTDRVNLEKKQRRNFVIHTIKDENIYVNGHHDLLTHAFEEIFLNAAHCTQNDDTTITMSLNVSDITGIIELVIFQDKAFIQNSRINGIDKIIKPIFEAFCGLDGIVLERDHKKKYVITIKFNGPDLKNN
ncbi:hypothetical protein LJ707_09100 [Mucilaginibacter sp. UR6-1]|uniref:hypothetical protein n=1 Tax=Mucilaginibacter sp. UR6-1 TaxID=1435643 RepID=UPI001E2F8DC8|nr:hypothetical protein [Mucilaginibacter sp. UR6-1]MCC8409086.1 hypothetical protein [Mucilaginibacter sp. UR6-1]